MDTIHTIHLITTVITLLISSLHAAVNIFVAYKDKKLHSTCCNGKCCDLNVT